MLDEGYTSPGDRVSPPEDAIGTRSVLLMANGRNTRLVVEAVAAGLAFGSILWWASTCLVAAFRPQDLAAPYWDGVPWLRTDTSGFAAFTVAAVCLACSRYLQMRRLNDGGRNQAMATSPAATAQGSTDTPVLLALLAVSETVAVLATGLVLYLSLNAITHPASLRLQASHLFPGPAEGTLRMVALLLCACSMALRRYLSPLAPR